MASALALLRRVVERAGRAVEYALTGQSDFAVLTSETRDYTHVTDLVKGKRILDEARRMLERDFAIRVQAPLLLELIPEHEARSARSHDTLGYYKPHALGEHGTHTVFVQKGLARARFKAIAAHEIVHAYEREANILSSQRALREGFARWVEYKVLMAEGQTAEAKRLQQIRNWRFGRSIRTLLEVEKERGVSGVLAYVRSIP